MEQPKPPGQETPPDPKTDGAGSCPLFHHLPYLTRWFLSRGSAIPASGCSFPHFCPHETGEGTRPISLVQYPFRPSSGPKNVVQRPGCPLMASENFHPPHQNPPGPGDSFFKKGNANPDNPLNQPIQKFSIFPGVIQARGNEFRRLPFAKVYQKDFNRRGRIPTGVSPRGGLPGWDPSPPRRVPTDFRSAGSPGVLIPGFPPTL